MQVLIGSQPGSGRRDDEGSEQGDGSLRQLPNLFDRQCAGSRPSDGWQLDVGKRSRDDQPIVHRRPEDRPGDGVNLTCRVWGE